MSMDLFGVAVFCITAAVLALMLRQYRPEYAVFVSLACSLVVVLYLLQGIAQVVERTFLPIPSSPGSWWGW